MKVGDHVKFVRHNREERAIVLEADSDLLKETHVRIEVQTGFDKGQQWLFPRCSLSPARASVRA